MGRITRDTWAARVEKWKESGRSVKEYAAEIGVDARRLAWWRWHFTKSPDSAPKRALVQRPADAMEKKAAKMSPLKFVEVTSALEADRLEVVLPSSLKVRVRPGFDSATLGQLLDVLESRH